MDANTTQAMLDWMTVVLKHHPLDQSDLALLALAHFNPDARRADGLDIIGAMRCAGLAVPGGQHVRYYFLKQPPSYATIPSGSVSHTRWEPSERIPAMDRNIHEWCPSAERWLLIENLPVDPEVHGHADYRSRLTDHQLFHHDMTPADPLARLLYLFSNELNGGEWPLPSYLFDRSLTEVPRIQPPATPLEAAAAVLRRYALNAG